MLKKFLKKKDFKIEKIMEWYIFLISMFAIMLDPIQIFSRQYSLSTMTFVFNNYIVCMIFNLVSTFGLWFYYLYN